MNTDPRYPIGKLPAAVELSGEDRVRMIGEIAAAPVLFRAAISGLSNAQLDTPYREGGWTVRQVVHHIPDSHMNAYVRFKLALTETDPVIKPYAEGAWANLNDTFETPCETSLALLELLHQRWVILLRGIAESDWTRNFRHPEMGSVSLNRALAIYVWHGKHHTAHVMELRKRKNW